MGALLILFISMTVISICAALMLLITKEKNKQNIAFIFAGAVSVIITLLNVTSLPTNWVMEKCIAWLMGVPAIIGLVLYFVVKKYYMLSKILIVSSMILGIIKIFF